MKSLLLFLTLCAGTASAQQYARLDSSFHGNGRLVLPDPIETLPQVYAKQALQPDGKILICGNRSTGLFTSEATITRIKANGNPDSTFGTNGTWAGTIIQGGQNRAIGVAVQPDGKIVAGGTAGDGAGIDRLFVLRLTGDGALDASFAAAGTGQYDVNEEQERVTDMKLQSNGKILLCGIASTSSAADSGFVVRVNADGSIDNGFAQGGVFRYQHTGDMTDFYAVDADSAGRIVVGGSWYSGSNYQDYILLRLTATGALDATFGSGGVFTNDHFNDYDEVHSLRILAGGSLIAAGYSYNGNNDGITALKLTAGGALDATFGTGGRTYVGNATAAVRGYGLALQSDGKVLIAGSMPDSNFYYDFVLLRLTAAGRPDTSFSPGTGYVVTDLSTNDDMAGSVNVQPDGRILVYGVTVVNTATLDQQPVLARYLSGPAVVTPPQGIAAAAVSGPRVYPSPLRGSRLFVAAAPGHSYKALLYNGAGQLVREAHVDAAQTFITIDASLPDGAYQLLLQDEGDNSRSAHRLLIQRN